MARYASELSQEGKGVTGRGGLRADYPGFIEKKGERKVFFGG